MGVRVSDNLRTSTRSFEFIVFSNTRGFAGEFHLLIPGHRNNFHRLQGDKMEVGKNFRMGFRTGKSLPYMYNQVEVCLQLPNQQMKESMLLGNM